MRMSPSSVSLVMPATSTFPRLSSKRQHHLLSHPRRKGESTAGELQRHFSCELSWFANCQDLLILPGSADRDCPIQDNKQRNIGTRGFIENLSTTYRNGVAPSNCECESDVFSIEVSDCLASPCEYLAPSQGSFFDLA